MSRQPSPAEKHCQRVGHCGEAVCCHCGAPTNEVSRQWYRGVWGEDYEAPDFAQPATPGEQS